jgi:hypothetical protein
VDKKYNGTAHDAVGPMEVALNAYGGVQPLVAGYFGEINPRFDRLLGDAAAAGVMQLQDALHAKSKRGPCCCGSCDARWHRRSSVPTSTACGTS